MLQIQTTLSQYPTIRNFFEQCDISDYARVIEVFENFKPECVIHFAAESHVDRSIESGYEFMVSNVLGTHVLLEASREVGLSSSFMSVPMKYTAPPITTLFPRIRI